MTCQLGERLVSSPVFQSGARLPWGAWHPGSGSVSGVTIKAVMAARAGVVLVLMCMDRVERSHHHFYIADQGSSASTMGGMG